jgi:leucyl aminopeptidase
MKIQLMYDRLSQVKTDLLVVILDEERTFHDLSGSPLQETVKRVQRDFKDKKLKTEYFSALDGKHGPKNVAIFSTGLAKSYNVWEALKIFVAKSIAMAQQRSLEHITIALNAKDAVPFIGKAVEGAVLGSYTFDKYRKEKTDLSRLRVHLAAMRETDITNKRYVERYSLVSNAINEARDLINEPGCAVVPETMAEAARKIAKEADLDVKVWDEKRLNKEGYNGLLQVGRGSIHPPRMIRLAYRAKKAKRHLAFVGKGITFDTGGISIKPADKMWEMKGDMAGGAAVLGVMSALSALGCRVPVEATICAAENMISGEAFRPGDIIRALNGVAIEVLSTDAEGRLVLADGLVDTARRGATELIDLATLTGAAVVALGEGTTALFSSDDDLAARLLAAAAEAGERMWRMPLIDELNEKIKGDVGDVKNSGGRAGGAITAALFLQRFTEGLPWAHFDIAGSARLPKAGPEGPKGASGVGVRTLLDYLVPGATG